MISRTPMAHLQKITTTCLLAACSLATQAAQQPHAEQMAQRWNNQINDGAITGIGIFEFNEEEQLLLFTGQSSPAWAVDHAPHCGGR